MPNITDQILIELLDGEVAAAQVPEVMAAIHNDPAAHEQWEYLQLAKAAVRHGALANQVAAVKEQYYAGQAGNVTIAKKGIVRKLTFNAMKVAACLFIVLGGWGVLKYTLTSPKDIYNHNYSSYELNTSRGADAAGQLENSYRQKDWNAVVALFNRETNADNKAVFLTAMAEMELKKYPDAIRHLNAIVNKNTTAAEAGFEDEAQYYLALCYLATGQTSQASALFNEIKANPAHLYYKKVRDMSFMDQQVLKYKKQP